MVAKISELEAEVALQKEEQKKEYATFEEEKMGLLNELKKEKQSRDEIGDPILFFSSRLALLNLKNIL